ncbi:hypothetical protein HII36_06455 [Nonomuraea sp. NN258]|uniref:hypothetical protein n=1 Tax=Nonomuraea antri TaxID=2730852 RepID=UPI00156A6D17|nr:hypothetical protein [Nonomuraea antri]NRQ31482.1 hypothetical protein [Nonomuraea antri]
MGFRTYAGRVRDRDLPFKRRFSALRCAVGHYHPIGFNATWSYLTTTGNLRRDESALIRALDVLELSRSAWLAEIDAFAARRRLEKRKHRRSPLASETRYLYGYRWPGPEGHRVMFRAVGILWAQHALVPFPEVSTSERDKLVELNATIADCVSTYLRNNGTVGSGHRDTLHSCLRKLNTHLIHHFPSPFHDAFVYHHRLLKVTELLVNDAFPVRHREPG